MGLAAWASDKRDLTKLAGITANFMRRAESREPLGIAHHGEQRLRDV